jgi:hypothetical protein
LRISTEIFVVRRGHVADHQGDVALRLEGTYSAFNAGNRLADHVSNGVTPTILYAPSARIRETAEEIARGLRSVLRATSRNAARVSSPRAEQPIRNFHFIIDDALCPPTNRTHASLPASAEQNPFLIGF